MSEEYNTILKAIDSWQRREGVQEVTLNRTELNRLVEYIQSTDSNFVKIKTTAGTIGPTIQLYEVSFKGFKEESVNETNISDYDSW